MSVASIETSVVEIVQHCHNVEKSAKLYHVLGFTSSSQAADQSVLLTAGNTSSSTNGSHHHHHHGNGNSSGGSALSIRLLPGAPAVKLPAPIPTTLLRVVVPNPGSITRDLLDAGWSRVASGDSDGVLQFAGCDGQLLQIIATEKQAETAASDSANSSHSKGRRAHRHDSTNSLRHQKSASLRRRHHHHHHHSSTAGNNANASETSEPSTPNVAAASAATSPAAAAPAASVTARSVPLQVGFHTETGQRDSNEDAHLMEVSLPFDATTAIFAVFDGHGGAKASRFCEKKFVSFLEKAKAYASDKKAALTDAFIKCDKKYLEKVDEDGCTAVVVLLTADNHLYVAHAGDSRAILIPAGGTAPVVALTADHKPEQENEKKRIEAAGHEVVRDTIVQHGKRVHTFRIDSVLSVARSIGDVQYKDSFDLEPAQQAVTCVPDVSDRQVAAGDAVLLACDGLFDVMTNEVVAEKVRKARAAGESLDAIAKQLVNTAINELGSDDNVSVVLVEIAK